MYTISGSDATTEIEDAVAILNWMPSGLEMALPLSFLNAKPDFSKVALVGHSRGGKVVFGLALGLRNSILQYSAVVGLDPVDGNAKGIQTQPPILRFSQHSLNLGVPTLIVGSGLGSLKRNYLFPPCAPEGVSHQAFFFDSSAPAFHFVAKEYGHMDFLDDDCKGAQGKLSYCVCKNGPSRSPMRRFAGEILVVFLLSDDQFLNQFLPPYLFVLRNLHHPIRHLCGAPGQASDGLCMLHINVLNVLY
jgi:chlorophyllase